MSAPDTAALAARLREYALSDEWRSHVGTFRLDLHAASAALDALTAPRPEASEDEAPFDGTCATCGARPPYACSPDCDCERCTDPDGYEGDGGVPAPAPSAPREALGEHARYLAGRLDQVATALECRFFAGYAADVAEAAALLRTPAPTTASEADIELVGFALYLSEKPEPRQHETDGGFDKGDPARRGRYIALARTAAKVFADLRVKNAAYAVDGVSAPARPEREGSNG